MITAVKEGSTVITATLDKGDGAQKKLTASCEVTVLKPTIQLDPTSATINSGSTRLIKATVQGSSDPVTWRSSNLNVATVNSSGVVSAIDAGQTIITAKVAGIEATCNITVVPAVKLSKTSLTIIKGKSYTLKATVFETKGTPVWKSSKPSVASVSSKGVVTGKNVGTAVITVSIGGGKATCKVTVKKLDYKYLYQQFLEKGSFTTKAGNRTYSVKMTSFYLLDIDKNKIPELIIKESGSSKWDALGTHYVFTIKKNKVVLAGSITVRGQRDIYYSPKYRALYHGGWTNYVGGIWQFLTKLNGSTLKDYKYSREGNTSMGSLTREYITGTSATKYSKVSKKAYTSFCNKYFNVKGRKTYSFVDNTETNRKKMLK